MPLFALLTLTACSSKEKPRLEEFFRTEIREDGSKMFAFSLILARDTDGERQKNTTSPQPVKREGRRGKGGRGQGTNPKLNSDNTASKGQEKLAELFQQRLDIRLETSRYCREGYMELEKSFVGAIYTLRGECNESATEQDRKHFL